jgi:hypothetical protein
VPGGDKSPVFIHLPREDSIQIMKNGRGICNARRTCASTQRQPLSRGNLNCVFTEDGNKYCYIGAQPGRAERGVQSGLESPTSPQQALLGCCMPQRAGEGSGTRQKPKTNLETDEFASNPPFLKNYLAGVISHGTFGGNDGFKKN